MPALSEIVVHPQLSERSHYRYQFTPKHHGHGSGYKPPASEWIAEMTLETEFGIFNAADFHAIRDDDENMYGILRDDEGELLMLGIWNEQVAEFPRTRDGEAWHGYPLYPLVEQGPESRRGQKCRPEKVVFDRMVDAALITPRQRKRLLKGDYA